MKKHTNESQFDSDSLLIKVNKWKELLDYPNSIRLEVESSTENVKFESEYLPKNKTEKNVKFESNLPKNDYNPFEILKQIFI